MKPLFGIDFGRIPVYQIALAVAMISAVIMFENALKKQGGFSKFMRRKVNISMIIGGLAGIAGANVINWFCYPELLDASLYERVMEGGFSSFFAILIFIGVSALVLRLNRVDVKYCLNLAVRPILLAQLLGRIGCLLRGCCLGKTVTLGSLTFDFPVRLLEMIFALTLFLIFSKRFFSKRMRIYLIAYPAFRFIVDFFRAGPSGSLFGIGLLTPVQVAALMILVTIGIIFVIRSIAREFKKPKPDVIKKKYEPLPNYFEEPIGTRHPGRTAAAVIAGVLITASLLIYFNPFHLSFFDDLRLGVKNSVSSIFVKRGKETELGSDNGVSLRKFDEKVNITGAKTAIEQVKAAEKLADPEYVCLKEGQLDNGGRYYVLNQTVGGVPVLGRAKVLVTDRDNNALFVIGDDGELTYSKRILTDYLPAFAGSGAAGTLSGLFPGKPELERTEFLYDTGEGLLRVFQVIISEDGITPGIGAVIDAKTEQVLAVTSPETGLGPGIQRARIVTAGENVLALIKSGNSEEIGRIGRTAKTYKKQTASAKAPELAADTVEAALCLAIINSGVDDELAEQILTDSNRLAAALPSVNENLYREIVAAQFETALLNAGKSASEASKAAETVRKSFSTAGISRKSDENALRLEATGRATKFKHNIDYTGDSDIFEVTAPADSTVEIQITSKTPLNISYTSETTGITVPQYVESQEKITFYPEDGTCFRVRISDGADPYSMRAGAAPYTVTVKAARNEKEIPKFITTALSRICDAYERSNLTLFLSVVEDPDHGEFSLDEAVGLELVMHGADSCYGCCGMGDGVDAVKATIALTLLPDGALPEEQIYDLRGSSLKLQCAEYIDKGDHYAVKARMQLTLNGLDLYSGYTLMRFDPTNEGKADNSSDRALPAPLDELSSFFRDDHYVITRLNTPELYELFGQEEAKSDLDSLYSLWEYSTYKGSGFTTTVVELDEARMAAMELSPEKAEAFRKFTARQNLIRLKQEKAMYEICADVFGALSTGGRAAKDIYDVCDNLPFFLGDKLFGDNEYWMLAKIIADPEGTATDLVVGAMLDGLAAEAADLRAISEGYDSLIAKYQAEV